MDQDQSQDRKTGNHKKIRERKVKLQVLSTGCKTNEWLDIEQERVKRWNELVQETK